MGDSGDPAAAPETEQDRRAAALLAARGHRAPWPACWAMIARTRLAQASRTCDACARYLPDQLSLTLGPSFTVQVDDRFSPGLTGRHDRAYALAAAAARDEALTLAALLLDAGQDLDGLGPWQRARLRVAAARSGWCEEPDGAAS